METVNVQMTDEGVMIPLEYLKNADDFEFEVRNGYVLVRPKRDDEAEQKQGWPYEWIGIGKSKNPNASVEVEEILMAEIDRRSGWTHKPPLEESEEKDT